MSDDKAMERAAALFDKVFHGVVQAPPTAATPGSYAGLNTQMIEATWGAEGLSMRDKRLIVMSVLLGSAADPQLFLLHARSALKSGDLTADDIRRVFNFVLFYAGAKTCSIPYQMFEAMLAAEETAS